MLTRAYTDLQKNLGFLDNQTNNNLTFQEFTSGNALLSFDLSRDGTCASLVSAGPQEGNLSFYADFHEALDEPVQFIFLLVCFHKVFVTLVCHDDNK